VEPFECRKRKREREREGEDWTPLSPIFLALSSCRVNRELFISWQVTSLFSAQVKEKRTGRIAGKPVRILRTWTIDRKNPHIHLCAALFLASARRFRAFLREHSDAVSIMCRRAVMVFCPTVNEDDLAGRIFSWKDIFFVDVTEIVPRDFSFAHASHFCDCRIAIKSTCDFLKGDLFTDSFLLTHRCKSHACKSRETCIL